MKLWRYGQPVEYLGRRYRLDGMLGSGGMADVCLAWDEREQREVALKILKSDDMDQETLNRFMKEAAQIADWQHPHILRVYESLQVELIDASSGSVLFYMVSEYARGGDLQKRLTPGRSFPLSTSFALFRQLCDAVQYAHERGVIHRDLKPLNMLFRRPESGPEEVVLSDFGLAVQVDASHHTFAHGGTLAYMAPEQFQDHALPASDIFALGVILYLLCVGSLPFRRTLQDIPRIVQGQSPVPTRPSLLNTELPPALDDVILRAMRELPAERYRQPREFWEAIELVLTMSAQTFPFVDDFWQNAGQTWPYDGSEQPQRSRQAGQQRQSPGTPASLPGEEAPEVEEGLVSALWIAREKQKASPVRLPLPTYSIPLPPNPGDDAAPEHISPAGGASAIWQSGDGAIRGTAGAGDERAAGGPNASEQARRRDTERAARDPGARGRSPFETMPAPGGPAPLAQPSPGNASNVARPIASASGSTILPGPRANARAGDPTSRRRQSFDASDDEQARQSSRRQPGSRAPASLDRQSSRHQPFEIFETSDAFNDDPTRQSSRRSANSQPSGLPVDDPPRQSSRRNVSEHDSYGVFDASGTFEDEAYPDSRANPLIRRAPPPRRSAPVTPPIPTRGSTHPPAGPQRGTVNASASPLKGWANASATSTRRARNTPAVPIRRARAALPHSRGVGTRRVPLVAVLCGVTLLLLLLAIFAATSFQGRVLTFLGAPITKITLQPRSQIVQDTVTLNVRTDGGQLASGEIPGRQLTATSPTQSATANATGSIPAIRATGNLTFLNNTAAPITIDTLTLAGTDGVQISFFGPVTVPAVPPSIIVRGYAVNPGASGNIRALDVSTSCCAPGIVVKNDKFTGGQDAQPNSVLQQKDIDGAAQPLVVSGEEQARANLQGQVRTGERVAGSAQCQPQITSDHKAGALVKQASVQVAVTCSETVYDYNAASQSFTRDLQHMESANPALGAAYALDGQVALTPLSVASAPDSGNPALQFHAQGLWVYQFSPAVLNSFAARIAGKSQDAARALLLQQPGVLGAQFSTSGTLPVNTSEIQITVQAPAPPV